MNRADRARLGYGLVLVVRPEILVRPTADHGRNRDFRNVVRVLGARHIVQAVVTSVHPTRRARRRGAVVDALHAATDIACAAVVPARRVGAFCDAAVAATFAVATLRNGAR